MIGDIINRPYNSITICIVLGKARYPKHRSLINMKVCFVLLLALGLSFSVFLKLCVCSYSHIIRNKVNTFDFFMPHVYPDMDNNHLCMQINVRGNFYLVGFEPKASMASVHQMLLYGCTEPGSSSTLWTCNERPNIKRVIPYETGSPCANGTQIVYGWARNASGFHLPAGVGLHIGVETSIKYLVLQVHYLKRYKEDSKLITVDNSGVILSYTRRRIPRKAGVLALGSGGVIPPLAMEHLESTCTIAEDKIVHPFAFRVHTHRMGAVVSAYVVRQGVSGDSWSTLANSNPARPQGWYSVRDSTPIRRGDIIAARCTMNNTSEYYVRIGKTDKDEACDFHLMYWVDNTPLKQKFCISPGPPAYYWSRALEHFQNIPDFHASIL